MLDASPLVAEDKNSMTELLSLVGIMYRNDWMSELSLRVLTSSQSAEMITTACEEGLADRGSSLRVEPNRQSYAPGDIICAAAHVHATELLEVTSRTYLSTNTSNSPTRRPAARPK